MKASTTMVLAGLIVAAPKMTDSTAGYFMVASGILALVFSLVEWIDARVATKSNGKEPS